MEPDFSSAPMSFNALMSSLRQTEDDPTHRLHEANRKLREATLRLKMANSRVQHSLVDLRFELVQIQQRHAELGSGPDYGSARRQPE